MYEINCPSVCFLYHFESVYNLFSNSKPTMKIEETIVFFPQMLLHKTRKNKEQLFLLAIEYIEDILKKQINREYIYLIFISFRALTASHFYDLYRK